MNHSVYLQPIPYLNTLNGNYNIVYFDTHQSINTFGKLKNGRLTDVLRDIAIYIYIILHYIKYMY